MRGFLGLLKIVLTIVLIVAFCWLIVWSLQKAGSGIGDAIKDIFKRGLIGVTDYIYQNLK